MQGDIDPAMIRAARAILKWRRDDLAKAAKTTERTVARIEDGDTSPRASTAQAIRDAFEAAGVVFIAENGGGPGVRLAKRKGARSGGRRVEPMSKRKGKRQ